jgi:hypothetical protein
MSTPRGMLGMPPDWKPPSEPPPTTSCGLFGSPECASTGTITVTVAANGTSVGSFAFTGGANAQGSASSCPSARSW